MTETMKCTSCREAVSSTDKFCKYCGIPNEQIVEKKTETAVVAENPNQKYVLTFDALYPKNMFNKVVYSIFDALDLKDIFFGKVVYSIEVDNDFIGKIKPGQKVETFVTRGKHYVNLKRNGIFSKKKKLEISVENNQIILLMVNRIRGGIEYSVANSDTQKQQREEMEERDKKRMKIYLWITVPFIILALLNLLASIL